MSVRVRVVLVLSSLLCLLVRPVRGQEAAEEMLQSALYKQQVEGDLQGAIELFAAIVENHAEERAVAARALLQLGFAYETLGSSEAERVFRGLVRDYPEQTSVVERASERLAVLSPDVTVESPGLTARRIWQTRMHEVPVGAVSPDGREIAFIQWGDYVPGSGNSGDLGVVKVGTEESRIVGRTPPFNGPGSGDDTYVVGSVWSRDGRRLAYSEWAETWDHFVLHVVNADGSGHRVVSDNLQNAGLQPRAWSSDGRWIVALITGWDRVRRIATVSMEDGAVTVLKTLRTGFSLSQISSMTLSLSPDDQFVAYAYSPSPRDEPDIRVLRVDGSGEAVIAPNAATDRSPLWTPDGSRLVFLSDRSGTADLWSVEMTDGHAAGEAHVVRPHVGPILPLGFTADGSLMYGTNVSERDLRVVSLESDAELTGGGEQLSERFVGYNSRAEWSPDGTRIAYLSTRPGPGLETRNYLVVKSLGDGQERDIELTMGLSGESRPAWSEDGDAVLLQAFEVERTETGVTTERASYRIDVESGEVQREPYIRDYAGFWRSSRARFVSERQSNSLRSLGIRIAGQRDIAAFSQHDEPLRAGESLLWVRNGIQWVRAIGCGEAASFPSAACVENDGDELLLEPVVELPPFGLMRGWELSPDGDRLAYILPDAQQPGVQNVWVRSVTMEGAPTLLHAHSDVRGCGCVIRWTPDGRHMIYGFDAPGMTGETENLERVYGIDVDGGEPQELDWPITRAQLGDLGFDPTGTRAVLEVGGDEKRFEVWSLSGFPWQEDGRE